MDRSSKQSAEQTIKRVFRRLDRRPQLSLIYGGATAAALCIFALFSQFSNRQMAESDLALQSETLNREIVQALVEGEPTLLQASAMVVEPVSIGLDKPIVNPPDFSSGNADNLQLHR